MQPSAPSASYLTCMPLQHSRVFTYHVQPALFDPHGAHARARVGALTDLILDMGEICCYEMDSRRT